MVCFSPVRHRLTACRQKDTIVVNEALTPFHIAVQVRDIAEARRFYGKVLGCSEGRSSAQWVDFNLYGHQFVCHLNPNLGSSGKLESHFNPVDGQGVPVPHCGVVLRPAQWAELAERMRRHQVEFVIEPYTRFKGQTGEQSTMFFLDPTGNALEFKAFQDIEAHLFAVDTPASSGP
jgi:extradiol dioxygenase family protein